MTDPLVVTLAEIKRLQAYEAAYKAIFEREPRRDMEISVSEGNLVLVMTREPFFNRQIIQVGELSALPRLLDLKIAEMDADLDRVIAKAKEGGWKQGKIRKHEHD